MAISYRIKDGKEKELKGGMTIKSLSEIIGVTNPYLIGTFNRKNSVKKAVAASLVSFRERVWIGSRECENFLDYYFTREENNNNEE